MESQSLVVADAATRTRISDTSNNGTNPKSFRVKSVIVILGRPSREIGLLMSMQTLWIFKTHKAELSCHNLNIHTFGRTVCQVMASAFRLFTDSSNPYRVYIAVDPRQALEQTKRKPRLPATNKKTPSIGTLSSWRPILRVPMASKGRLVNSDRPLLD